MPHILVADDHPMCATALAMAARAVDAGITKDCVTTLAEAESLVRRTDYDLILLDLMLPDVQGFAGLAMLRAIRPAATIAIVSGREEPAVVAQARALGAKGFIPRSSSDSRRGDFFSNWSSNASSRAQSPSRSARK